MAQFRQFFELFDNTSADASAVRLEPVSTIYGQPALRHTFKVPDVDGRQQDFKVTMVRHKGFQLPNGIRVKDSDSYNVELEGPAGTKLTGRSGINATIVYRQLLLAVRKLMDSEDVGAITFVPAEDDMNLPYTRFVKSYVRPEFSEVSPGFFVRKSILRDTGVDPAIMSGILRSSRVRRDQLAAVTRNRRMAKKFNDPSYRQAMVNRFYRFKAPADFGGYGGVVLVTHIQPSGASQGFVSGLVLMDGERRTSEFEVTFGWIEWDSEPNELGRRSLLKSLVDQVELETANRRVLSMVQDLPDSVFRDHGLEPPL